MEKNGKVTAVQKDKSKVGVKQGDIGSSERDREESEIALIMWACLCSQHPVGTTDVLMMSC